MTPTMQRVLDDLRDGRVLWWYGDDGPEMSGRPFWPQRRTVRAMLKRGLLRWKPWRNEGDKMAGVCELEAT